MSRGDFLPSVVFEYEYSKQGWAEAHIADDSNEYWFAPSFALGDPLFELVRAISLLLYADGTTRCRWFNEPSEDRWVLRRTSDALSISILWLRHYQTNDYHMEFSDSSGRKEFSTICDFWKFAARIRLFASRSIAREKQQGRHVAWENRTGYEYLEASLEQRKHAHK